MLNLDNKNKKLIWIILAVAFLPMFLQNKFLLGLLIAIIIIYLIFKKLKNKSMDNQPINISNFKGFKNAKKILWITVLVVFVLWLFLASIQIVDAGETGVYSLFGKVSDNERSSGFHLIIPLAKLTKMGIRTEEYTMSIISNEGKKTGADAITALTKEGLSVDLDITVLYRLNENQASDVYKNVGLNYEEKIIRPAIRSTIREVIAQYEAKDIYSEKRAEATQGIKISLETQINPCGIIIEEVLLRNVVLPANLANSIQEKLQAEQEAQKYDFLLQTEKKEKERKIIEAEGQRDSQAIINQSLTTNYLYYQYIKELENREGTIYVPTNPSTGMPMFRDVGY
ncbi:MAG: SPFH domain-containing protein [Patescibacteria group bacterium]|nr:SPFH domain-containing protein [Patescibacteria group bacterium]